jgi:hypothetical protein
MSNGNTCVGHTGAGVKVCAPTSHPDGTPRVGMRVPGQAVLTVCRGANFCAHIRLACTADGGTAQLVGAQTFAPAWPAPRVMCRYGRRPSQAGSLRPSRSPGSKGRRPCRAGV